MPNSLRPHGLQHTRSPCPSPTPGVYPNSCPSSWWCPLTISFSVAPFSSCLQFFPASGSFQMSQLFTSGGQIIGVSASASVPSNEHSGICVHHFTANRWVNSGNSGWLYFWGAPKSLQIMIEAMKLKHAYSLEGKLWPTQHIKKQRHYFAHKGLPGQGYGFSSGHVWMWELDC